MGENMHFLAVLHRDSTKFTIETDKKKPHLTAQKEGASYEELRAWTHIPLKHSQRSATREDATAASRWRDANLHHDEVISPLDATINGTRGQPWWPK